MRTILSFIAISITGVVMAQTPTKKEKTYTVNFDKTEWPKVFEWFAKETGLTYLGTNTLQGTLTLKSDKPLTRCEVWGLLNSKLEPLGYTIIFRSQSFFLHPVNERIPRGLVTLVQLDELESRCDQEVVQVIIPLTFLVADDVMPVAKKLLSVTGEAAAFGSNQIIVYDRVKNIRSIIKYIDVQWPRDHTDQYTHICKYVRASWVANNLSNCLKNELKETVTIVSFEWPNSGFGGFGKGFDKTGLGPWGSGKDTRSTETSRGTNIIIGKKVQIAVDYSANTILITGPSDKMEFIGTYIKLLDRGTELRTIGGKQFWKVYNLTESNAPEKAKWLFESIEFRGSNIKHIVQNSSQLMAYGYPADHIDIERYINSPVVIPQPVTCQPVCQTRPRPILRLFRCR